MIQTNCRDLNRVHISELLIKKGFVLPVYTNQNLSTDHNYSKKNSNFLLKVITANKVITLQRSIITQDKTSIDHYS